MRISDWSSDVCSSDLYSAHLDASGDAVSIGDIKVRLLFPIFFPDLNMANMFPETSGIMLLEKAFPCPALGAAHETDRPVCDPGQHDGGHGHIIFRQLALADIRSGKNDTIRVRDLDCRCGSIVLRRRHGTFRDDLLR